MGLNNTQRQKLREAIISAYPNKDRLELMLEDEFDCSLSSITLDNDYDLMIQNLIKRFEQQGKIRELVIGASKSNTGNPILKNCVQELLPNLLDDIDNNLLKVEVLNSLIDIIIDIIRDLLDFDVIKDCCLLTIPDLSVHRTQAVSDIENPALEPAVKWLIVLGLLLKDYRQTKDGIPYIIKFVHCLLSEVTNPEINHKIQLWLKQVKQDYSYPIASQINDNSNHKIVTIKGNLLIVIRNSITSGENANPSFLVNWFISIDKIQEDGSIQSQLIPPQEADLSVDIAQASQRGVSCKLKEIEDKLLEWVYQAETKLGNEAEKLSCPYYLTIEFFLPYEYLGEAVDLWQVRAGLARLRKLKPIGQKHRVVVRSLDRLEDRDLFNQLLKTWQQSEQFFQNNPCPTEIQTKIEQLDCPMGCNWEQLTRSLEKSQKIVLKLTCAMPNCTTRGSSTNALNDLFISLLEAGTPIALWFRRCNLVNGNMDQFLTLEMLRNSDKLLQQVTEVRRDATNDQDIGYHLAILYDEPQRLKHVKQFLQKNQLGVMSA